MVRNSPPRTALARLQAAGFKLTRPRRLIVETLAAQRAALTAQELHQLVRASEISLASVYRTLDLLVSLGLAETVARPGDEQRYLACSVDHHHHVICDGCGRVVDFDGCLLEPFVAAVEERTKFAIEGHTLEFHGRCATCQE